MDSFTNAGGVQQRWVIGPDLTEQMLFDVSSFQE